MPEREKKWRDEFCGVCRLSGSQNGKGMATTVGELPEKNVCVTFVGIHPDLYVLYGLGNTIIRIEIIKGEQNSALRNLKKKSKSF